jgi:uncharacterized protein YecT (DUF1311 family)
MTMRYVLLACLVGLAACGQQQKSATPPPAPAVANAIDCAAATSAVETAICADPDLVAQDEGIARAYNAALLLYAEAPDAEAELKTQQRLYNDTREVSLGAIPNAPTLGERLAGRAEELTGLVAPREGFAGSWMSATGLVTIALGEGDGFTVSMSRADPLAARWVCTIEAQAKLANGVLALHKNKETDSLLGGWKITLAREGALLRVIETAPASKSNEPAARPYCGMNGALEGAYLPAQMKG